MFNLNSFLVIQFNKDLWEFVDNLGCRPKYFKFILS